MADTHCFHCGEPIPSGVELRADVGGKAHAVCCIGCRAAAEWIAALGLDDYYRLRTAPAARAAVVEDFRAWDRAELQQLYVRKRADGDAETCLLVDGLRCAACCWLIERALRGLAGLRDIAVNAAAKRLYLVWKPDEIALSDILARIAHLGYEPRPLDAASLDAVARRESRTALKRLVVAGLGMMQSMMYAVALYAGAFEGMPPATRDFFRWLGLLATTPVVIYAGAPLFAGAWRELRARTPGMDTPVALAIALVYAASIVETVRGGAQVYFDSASMFVFLLLGARYIEMRGRHCAADMTDALARAQPAVAARRTADGALETVGVHELAPGDVVSVAAGGAIPGDGTLVAGFCEVDESLLTGESAPQRRRAGETLFAGSVARTGPIELRIARIGADTVLSSIARLVGRAQRQRPRWAELGDRVAARFVAGVLALTLATALGWWWFDPTRAFPAALAVLVVSCPCAFALSVPAALTRAMAVLAQRGVLVLKPDALEKLAHVRRIVFDKTGTLTARRIELVDIEPLGALDAASCLRIAASLEAANTHPLAAAIRAAAPDGSAPAQELVSVAGAGVSGRIDGHEYRLGRPGFALGEHAHPPLADGRVVLAGGGAALAAFRFREALRADAEAAVDELRAAGAELEILSGDAPAAVGQLARRLGIEHFHAALSPAGKLARLGAMRSGGALVAMVGDGINDAPVLAGADLAVALGDGADLAQASADIVLASGRLLALAEARTLARTTLAILRQNLAWAFAYNFLSIPAAAFGLIPPWLAAIGMSASSLFVVLNSLRIGLPRTPLATPPEIHREIAAT